MAARGRGAVALRIDVQTTLAVIRDFELLRHEHIHIKQPEFFPLAGIRNTEAVAVRLDQLHIGADCVLQVILNQAGHGRDVQHLDRTLFQPIIVAQLPDDRNVHLRAAHAAEVNRHFIRLLVRISALYALF